MRRTYLFGLVLSSFAITIACSSTPSTNDGGATDASNDISMQKDVGNDGTTTDGSPNDASNSDASDAGGDGAITFTLTINDYLSWCNVTVDDGGVSSATPQTFQFAPSSIVNLHGDTENAGAFYWGYFQGAGVADGGKDTNKDVTVTMNADQTVLACCPDNNTPLSCP